MPTLAERLKAETRSLHTAAERSPLMAALLRGQLARADYLALLRNLQAIYAALEPALDRHAGEQLLAPIWLPGLRRLPALESDLAALNGPDWADAPLQPAALRYAQRLQVASTAQLLAHAYVRYLGDLSGGQILKRIVGQNFAAEGGSFTSFYEFGDAATTSALTQAMRAGLVQLTPEPAQADVIVAEALLAFEWHRELFDELAAASPSLPAPSAN